MLEESPIQTFRGTLDEVLSHQGEIPPGAVLELRVYPSPAQIEEPSLADSLAELLEEASHVEKGEPIRYSNPRKQVVVDVVRAKFQKQGFEL